MNKNIIYSVICVLLLGIGANWIIQKADSSHQIPVIKKVPSFVFQTQEGNSFSEKDFIGKVTVLDFLFLFYAVPRPIKTKNIIQ